MSITPRPADWLAQLDAGGAEAYEALLKDAKGSLALAAHRLAVARAQSWERATDVPTARELFAAAHAIAIHVNWQAKIPPLQDLIDECEAHGALVIGGSSNRPRK